MSLRILVIGRGDDAAIKVANGHQLTFVPDAWKEYRVSYLEIDDYDFVIQHLSAANDEGPKAIAYWKTKKRGNALIGVSGGPVSLLRGVYASTGIPCIENCPFAADIKNLPWNQVPSDFADDAVALHRLLAAKNPCAEILIALSILCQGYLIVCANQGSGKNVPEFLNQWVLERGPDYSDRISQIQEYLFWDVFDQKDPSNLIKILEEEWKGLSGGGNFEDVKALILGLPTKEKPLTDNDVPMVSKAYDAIAARLREDCGK
jgi:hypothetical protein